MLSLGIVDFEILIKTIEFIVLKMTKTTVDTIKEIMNYLFKSILALNTPGTLSDWIKLAAPFLAN